MGSKNKTKTHLEFEVEDESTVRVYKQYQKEDGVYYPYPAWPDYAVPKFVIAYEEIPMKDGKYSLDLEEFTSETIIKIVDAGRNEFVEIITKFTLDSKNFSANENTNMMDVEPFAKDGRIMVPIRFVGMALGFDVNWDQATKTAILTNGEIIIKIPMNGKTFYVNDIPFVADAEPEIRSQRIFLSISNIAKALGLEEGKEIFWDQITKTATFIYNK